MRVAISALLGASALMLTAPAMAADEPAKTDETTIACGWPIAWDATEESLKAQFGAANVEYKDLGGPEGTEMFGTQIFPNDPKKTFDIVWADEEKRAAPSIITVNQIWSADGETTSDTEWTSASGVKTGMSIEAVEKINGKPFKLSGFGWDYGGNAISWEGGKLETTPDAECGISISFNQTADDSPESTLGDKEIASDDKDVIASKPVVSRYTVFYVRPDAEAPVEETPTP